MKRYETYKNSGVEWIGEIPEGWECVPMKRGMNIFNGKDYKDVVADSGYPVIGSGGPFAYASNYLYDGEAVLLGRKGTIDKPLYINGKFWTVDTMFYAVPKEGVHCKYMFYQSLNIPFERYSTNTALPSMTQTDLGENPMCFPPLSEQQQISSYLDYKVGQIDSSLAKIVEQIEDLKSYRQSVISEAVTKGLNPNAMMKDSGVEWIGEIPEGWKKSKIKYNCKINGRVGFRGYTTDDLVAEGEGAYTIGGKHISKNVIDLSSPDFISWDKYYESPEIMVKKGDIITAQRGTLGKTAYVEKEIGPATINPSLILINDIKTEGKYLYWYFVSNAFLSQVELANTATAIPMISQSQLGNFDIPLPPLSEQQQIASYLDSKTSKIDSSIQTLELQKSQLEDYKRSLISEAVTGKVDLRGWKTNNKNNIIYVRTT